MLSEPIYLDSGSIWFDAKPGKIIAFSPFKTKPRTYRSKGPISIKKVKGSFSRKDAFYFWLSRTLREELRSAQNIFSNRRNINTYHRNLQNSKGHFETSERTVSHMFRYPHPALSGLSYGSRLYQQLKERRIVPAKGFILEVGAGMGFLARDILTKLNGNINYIFLDLAPGMLKTQKRQNKEFSSFFVQANAEQLPFRSQSIDLVIANEVIADFSVNKFLKKDLNSGSLQIKRYNLKVSDAPCEFLVNTGAINFLEELKRVVKPKGSAVIIEYGEDWAYPTATKLKDHTEYSIHFGHLISVAKTLGFKIKYTNLFDFLQAKPSVRVITGNSLLLLQRLMKYLRRSLPAFAYTEEMLKCKLGTLYNRIHNLQFEKTEKLASLFRLQDFKALSLKK